MISYKISPKCVTPSGETLYLTVNKQTKQVVVWTEMADNDSAQLWTPIPWINGNGIQGFVLLNQMTNSIIAAPNNNAEVTLIDPKYTTMQEQRCSWNYSGSTERHDALQLYQNTDMNLNVAGGGSWNNNTPVLAYKWCNNQVNELWKFIPVCQ